MDSQSVSGVTRLAGPDAGRRDIMAVSFTECGLLCAAGLDLKGQTAAALRAAGNGAEGRAGGRQRYGYVIGKIAVSQFRVAFR